jgi:thiol-disulfide isomerase/thioredoxin
VTRSAFLSTGACFAPLRWRCRSRQSVPGALRRRPTILRLFFTERSQFVEKVPSVFVAAFSLHGARGDVRSIGSFSGKALLLNIWASWCAPCRRELPILDRIQTQSVDEPFQLAAVSIDRAPERAAAFLRELGLKRLKSYIDPERALSPPPDRSDPSPFKLYGLPMSYVIDRHGELVGYVAVPIGKAKRD